jgi:hypothetical protein
MYQFTTDTQCREEFRCLPSSTERRSVNLRHAERGLVGGFYLGAGRGALT